MSQYPELDKFISESKNNGVSDEEIKSKLLQSGWSINDINKAYKSTGSPTSSPTSGNSLKVFGVIFLILIIFIATGAFAYFQYFSSPTETNNKDVVASDVEIEENEDKLVSLENNETPQQASEPKQNINPQTQGYAPKGINCGVISTEDSGEAYNDPAWKCLSKNILNSCTPAYATEETRGSYLEFTNPDSDCLITHRYLKADKIPIEGQKQYAEQFMTCKISTIMEWGEKGMGAMPSEYENENDLAYNLNEILGFAGFTYIYGDDNPGNSIIEEGCYGSFIGS